MSSTTTRTPTVEVWSQPACSGCQTAKQVLQSRKIPYIEKLIGANGLTKQDLLAAVPDARSVPQIVVDGKPIGGLKELQEWIKWVQ